MLRTSLLALVALSAISSAQFSKDPTLNLSVAQGAWDQVQAKVVAIPAGGAYVSWYDSDPGGAPAFGYDVRLQRLDPSGNALWPAGGVLVADRGFSSTQDYGLAVDAAGHALLAFRDDRFVGVQVSAARIDPDGAAVWGPGGVQLTSTGAFVAAPRIAGTSDGDVVVGWTQDSASVLQRLDATGAALWGAGLSIPPPPGGSTSVSALHASDSGDVILAWVQQSGGFFTPRELWTMKLDDAGVPQWPVPGVPVFTTGSLQIGSFPDFEPDGAGGAVFAWYGTSPLQCYAQHVLASGALAYGPGGSEVSTDLTQVRATPRVTHDPATLETYVFWDERNAAQSMSGFFAQKFDASGARLWTDSGLAIEPIQAGTVGQVAAVFDGTNTAAFWERTPTFGDGQIFGVHVDPSGSSTHATTPSSTVGASIDDFGVALGAFGDVQLVWHDDRTANFDVFAQNMTLTGALGAATGVLGRSAGANPNSYTLDPAPLGGVATATLDVAASGLPFGTVLGYLGALELPLGGGVVLLVDVTHFLGELLGQPLLSDPTSTFLLPVPPNPAICGLVLNTQGVHLDAGGSFALSNAQDWHLGL